MPDLDVQLDETERGFGLRQIHAGHAVMVVMARQLPHPIEEVWGAVTEPDRIGRYLLGPEGDFRRGGDFRLPDGTTGCIERCDPPRLLTLNWTPPHGQAGELELRLTAEEDSTRVELRYASVRKRFVYSDPGGDDWPAGPGWEFVLDRLQGHLDGELDSPPPFPESRAELQGPVLELFELRNSAWAKAKAEFDREHRAGPRR